MTRFFRILALIGMALPLLSSCGVVSPHALTVAIQGPYFEDSTRTDLLGEHGEQYEKRSTNLLDISDFRPYPGEAYDDYHVRVLNTLHIQEYNITLLQEAIEAKKGSQDHLSEQLMNLRAQHADLRLALATIAEGKDPSGGQTEGSFKRYVVEPGDTLQSIAKDHYGTHTGWLTIYRFNYQDLPNGPNTVEVGDVLILPKRIEPPADPIEEG